MANIKKVYVIDYDAWNSYAPPQKEAVINTEHIVSAVPCESRFSEPTMLVRFTDGSHQTVVGKPEDLL